MAPSLGGVETLITRPVTTTHVGMSPEELKVSPAIMRCASSSVHAVTPHHLHCSSFVVGLGPPFLHVHNIVSYAGTYVC